MRSAAVALACWVAGLALAFYPALASGFDELQIRNGDPRLVHYILEHTWLWVTQTAGHTSFWNPPVYWPAEAAGGLSDTMVAAGPFYWIWRVGGAGPGLAFQLWMMTALSLNFFLGRALLRRGLGVEADAASVGAFLYGFGIARLANFNSPQLFACFWATLFFLALARACSDEVGRRNRRRWIVTAGLAFAAQVYSAFYPAFFAGLIAAAAAAVALCLPESRRLVAVAVREAKWTWLAVAGVTALLLVPWIRVSLATATDAGWRESSEIAWGFPQWNTWLFPGKDSWLYGSWAGSSFFRFESIVAQHSNGVGPLTTVIALAGLWFGRRRLGVRVVALTTLALILIVTEWPGGFSIWGQLQGVVPGTGAVRYLARIGMYLLLPAGLGIALAVQRLRSPAWGALVLAVVAAEQGHRLTARDERAFESAVEELARDVNPAADAFFLSTRADAGFANSRVREMRMRHTNLVAMWVAVEAGVPCVNGFYGLDPGGFPLRDPNPRSEAEQTQLARELVRWLRTHDRDPARVQRLDVDVGRMPWARSETDSE